ncbi:sugar ABC transporter substrate-binding protein [Rhizobium laguerreae]|uniref:substrate-binding domain-containing protein n=1 Tax=Rhizobium laguerreae TaxID=1076926 RepID=UPI001C901989|nr:substrate-binding domain-containing protein [Rhizobium laguerreae]MBY3465688.1 sugar ABC transporter substrate-binding protein [Rhizobium laguerreae]
MRERRALLKIAALGGAFALACSTPAEAADISACLITKTDTNPSALRMKTAAIAEAKALGIDLKSFSGKIDGDSESQIAAIEHCIVDGAKGIMISASDTKAIVPSVKKARDAGLLVIALGVPLEPSDAADTTIAADNQRAGQALGEWAKGQLGGRVGKIGFLESTSAKPAAETLRDQGFMLGLGISPDDASKGVGAQNDRIVGHDVVQGSEADGNSAMMDLLGKEPGIAVVHIDDDAMARGASKALEALGKKKDVMIVSTDGCAGVEAVAKGVVDATFMTDLKSVGRLGVRAIERFATTGQKPTPSAGMNFQDAGGFVVAKIPGADHQTNPICTTDPYACAYTPITTASAQAICQ